MSQRWTPSDLADYQSRRSGPRIKIAKSEARSIKPLDIVRSDKGKEIESQSKYKAKRTEVDGITFASKREATRYQDLKVMQQLGLISGLTLQPKYPLEVNGVKICTYIGDFLYFENGERVTEDTKGVKTPAYRLKKKLMLAIYGISIRES